MNNKVFSLILGLSFVVGCFAQAHLPVLDTCIECSSFTQGRCATDPESLDQKPCETLPTQLGCYTRVIDGTTYRGCVSDLDQGVLTGCRNQGNDTCITCQGNPNEPIFGCNNLVFPVDRRRCHQCQEALNGTCEGIPRGLPTVCEVFDENDRCFIHRTSTTITRGCLSDRRALCANPEHCEICEFSGCNIMHGELVPIAPGSAVTNKISMVMLLTAFIFALAKFI